MSSTHVTRYLEGEKDKISLDHLYRQCFPVNSESSFFRDFPIWDCSLNIKDRYQLGIFKNENIISSLSIKLANIKQSTHPIGLIGAVSTLPDFRGQGLAKSLLKEAIDLLDQKNVKNIFLWGSEKKLYQNFEFLTSGQQRRSQLGSLIFKNFQSKLNSKPTLEEGWNLQIFEIMKNRKSGLERNDSDLVWILKQSSVLYLSILRNKKCTAFVGMGRGIDLGNIIHEWGGDSQDLELLLSVIQKENPNLEILFHPNHVDEYSFLKTDSNPIEENLCMSRIKDPNLDLNSVWFYGLDSC